MHLFRVPVDNPQIANMNTAQMLWSINMLDKQEKFKFDQNIEYLQYLAWFINPEMVRNIKESKTVSATDEEFNETVKNLFGKDIDMNKASQVNDGDISDIVDRVSGQEQVISNDNIKNKKPISINDLKRYLDMNLDEIKFTPKKRK